MVLASVPVDSARRLVALPAPARRRPYRKCDSLATQPPYPADPFTSSARTLRRASMRSRLASRARASVRSTHSSHDLSVGAHGTLNCSHRITAMLLALASLTPRSSPYGHRNRHIPRSVTVSRPRIVGLAHCPYPILPATFLRAREGSELSAVLRGGSPRNLTTMTRENASRAYPQAAQARLIACSGTRRAAPAP